MIAYDMWNMIEDLSISPVRTAYVYYMHGLRKSRIMAACCQEIFLTLQDFFWETSKLRMKFAKLETFLITLEIFEKNYVMKR